MGVRDQAIGAAVGVVVAGFLGVIGSALTGGALIKALGGVTATDVADTVKSSLGIPKGVVVAFDLPISGDRPEGCPKGWSAMRDLDGRVILGAGLARNQKYGYRDIGGEEEVTLSLPQMPKHQHLLPVAQNEPNEEWAFRADGEGNWTGVHHRISDFSGGDEPHNNMPPYIALYFCKKN